MKWQNCSFTEALKFNKEVPVKASPKSSSRVHIYGVGELKDSTMEIDKAFGLLWQRQVKPETWRIAVSPSGRIKDPDDILSDPSGFFKVVEVQEVLKEPNHCHITGTAIEKSEDLVAEIVKLRGLLSGTDINDEAHAFVREMNDKLYGPKFCHHCQKIQKVKTHILQGSEKETWDGTKFTKSFVGAHVCYVCNNLISDPKIAALPKELRGAESVDPQSQE